MLLNTEQMVSSPFLGKRLQPGLPSPLTSQPAALRMKNVIFVVPDGTGPRKLPVSKTFTD
jgi:alkaline phosphatase